MQHFLIAWALLLLIVPATFLTYGYAGIGWATVVSVTLALLIDHHINSPADISL